MNLPPFLARWFSKPNTLDQLAAELDARLAERKAKRPARSEAAHRGHQTRKLNKFNQGSI